MQDIWLDAITCYTNSRSAGPRVSSESEQVSMKSNAVPEPEQWARLAWRHRVWGWRLVLVYVTMGLALAALRGLKIGFYLDPAQEVRREMWTLAHAHGTLVGIVQVLFSAALAKWRSWSRARLCSALLFWAAVLLPTGFVLAGIAPSVDEPWIGVALVPVGGLFLCAAVFLIAREAYAAGPSPP